MPVIISVLLGTSPCVGMVWKQDGGSNGCISNYTMITQLEASVTHFEALSCSFSSAALVNKIAKIVCQQR